MFPFWNECIHLTESFSCLDALQWTAACPGNLTNVRHVRMAIKARISSILLKRYTLMCSCEGVVWMFGTAHKAFWVLHASLSFTIYLSLLRWGGGIRQWGSKLFRLLIFMVSLDSQCCFYPSYSTVCVVSIKWVIKDLRKRIRCLEVMRAAFVPLSVQINCMRTAEKCSSDEPLVV